MERSLKSIFWMSWTLRRRILCSNYAMPSRIVKSSSQGYSCTNENIDLVNNLVPAKEKTVETKNNLTAEIVNILNSTALKYQAMDLESLMNKLRHLAKEIKNNNDKLKLENQMSTQILCELLSKYTRIMTLNNVLETIKLLSTCGVSTNTNIMQSLLQLVKMSINDLSLNQIYMLTILLRKTSFTELSFALLQGLNIRTNQYVNKELDHSNLQELSTVLELFGIQKNADSVAKVCRYIQVHIKNYMAIPLGPVNDIFLILCKREYKQIDTNEIFITIKIIQNILLDRIQELSLKEVEKYIQAICYAATNGYMTPYSTHFINSLLQFFMSKNTDFMLGYRVAYNLNTICYVHEPFAKYLLNKSINEKLYIAHISLLISALSNSGYESIPWNKLEPTIRSTEALEATKITTLITLAINLIALNKYYPEVLSKIFTQVNSLSLSEFTLKLRIDLLMLYQVVKICYPEYKGVWPSKEVLNHSFNCGHYIMRTFLKETVERVVGGPEYIFKSVKTRLGTDIDCAIIMHENGHPIACNTKNLDTRFTSVEELICPPEGHVILILGLPRWSYSINVPSLTYLHMFYLKCIEKYTDCKCMDINLIAWYKLEPNARTLFIKEKIKHICDNVAST